MEESHWRNLVRSELERAAVVEAISDIKKPSTPWTVLRHPLLITVVGFFFTGLFGWYAQMKLEETADRRKFAEQENQRIEAREIEARRTMISYAENSHRRLMATDLLRSALRRGNAASIERRKINYDTAYVEWNVGFHRDLMSLRMALSDAGERQVWATTSQHEELVRAKVFPLFARIDRCLTEVFDLTMQNAADVGDHQCQDGPWHTRVHEDTLAVRKCISSIVSNALSHIRERAQGEILLTQIRLPATEATSGTALPEGDATLEEFCSDPLDDRDDSAVGRDPRRGQGDQDGRRGQMSFAAE